METGSLSWQKFSFKETFEITTFFSKIWELYRRNFAKGKTFRDTRKTCIRKNKIETGSPCPICRDEYLVLFQSRSFKVGKVLFIPSKSCFIRWLTTEIWSWLRNSWTNIMEKCSALLKQVTSSFSWLLFQFINIWLVAGVCQLQNRKILIEIERARDRGLLKVDPPFIEYDYSLYKPRDSE